MLNDNEMTPKDMGEMDRFQTPMKHEHHAWDVGMKALEYPFILLSCEFCLYQCQICLKIA